MEFGLTFEKLLVLGVIAAIVIGPERLPRYAEQLAAFTRRARQWAHDTRTRVKDEMGEDFDDVDWRTLDPRQYDPRRIIREALLDDTAVAVPKTSATMAPVVPTAAVGAGVAAGASSAVAGSAEAAEAPPRTGFRAGGPVPYDSEAT